MGHRLLWLHFLQILSCHADISFSFPHFLTLSMKQTGITVFKEFVPKCMLENRSPNQATKLCLAKNYKRSEVHRIILFFQPSPFSSSFSSLPLPFLFTWLLAHAGLRARLLQTSQGLVFEPRRDNDYVGQLVAVFKTL